MNNNGSSFVKSLFADFYFEFAEYTILNHTPKKTSRKATCVTSARI